MSVLDHSPDTHASICPRMPQCARRGSGTFSFFFSQLKEPQGLIITAHARSRPSHPNHRRDTVLVLAAVACAPPPPPRSYTCLFAVGSRRSGGAAVLMFGIVTSGFTHGSITREHHHALGPREEGRGGGGQREGAGGPEFTQRPSLPW